MPISGPQFWERGLMEAYNHHCLSISILHSTGLPQGAAPHHLDWHFPCMKTLTTM